MRAVVSQASNKPARFVPNFPTDGQAISHSKRNRALWIIGGGAVGFALVYTFMRPEKCALTYDGKPYFGTPPCPK